MEVWAFSLLTHQLSPTCLTRMKKLLCIRSLIEAYILRRRNSFSALPHSTYNIPLYLNIFRGEPAISGFVWHIAPNLKSSQPIATDTSSGLLLSFRQHSPCSRLAHPVSGLMTATNGRLGHAFTLSTSMNDLN